MLSEERHSKSCRSATDFSRAYAQCWHHNRPRALALIEISNFCRVLYMWRLKKTMYPQQFGKRKGLTNLWQRLRSLQSSLAEKRQVIAAVKHQSILGTRHINPPGDGGREKHWTDYFTPSEPLHTSDRSDRSRSDAVQDLRSTDPTNRKYVLDHADYTAPTRQNELDHTDQECICPAWQI